MSIFKRSLLDKIRPLTEMKVAREAVGLSIKDLASMTDCSTQTIMRIELAIFTPHRLIREKICTALGASMDQLFDEEGRAIIVPR